MAKSPEQIEISLFTELSLAMLSGVFGGVATVLAAVGVAVGAGATWAVTRLIQAQLFSIRGYVAFALISERRPRPGGCKLATRLKWGFPLPAESANLETTNAPSRVALIGLDHMPRTARIFIKTRRNFQLTGQDVRTAVVL